MLEEREGYQGWKNYPTWAVNLWLRNDRAHYDASLGVVAGADEPGRAADALREWIEDRSPLAGEAGLYVELLGWALRAVDWDELARVFGPEEWRRDEPPPTP